MKLRMTNVATGLTAAVLVGLLSACSGGAQPQQPDAPASNSQDGPVEQLVAEAKAEGSVSVYAVMDERMVQKVQSAFREKYGIEMTYLRTTAAEIAQRFNAEKDAQSPVADVVLNLHDGFIADGLKDGSFKKLEEADIPDYPNALAEEALVDGAAIVQVSQLSIGYNTDQAQNLKGWQDLLDPSLKGKVAIASPDNGIYNALFYSLEREYGEKYLTDLGGQISRVYSSGAQIIEAVGSGEAYAVAGTLAAAIDIAKSQGAPVEATVPTPTLNAPTLMAINAEAPHPAAARLLAHYLTTEEGLKAINDGPGLAAPTDSAVLTSGWMYNPELHAEAATRRDAIKKALGVG